jgi:hypothetical protein
MTKRIYEKRYLITILLSVVGVAIVFYYSACGDACLYLKGGVFGFDLVYVGILFMVCLMGLCAVKSDAALVAMLSSGVGVEAFLLGFQFWSDTYCPYCVAYGMIIIVQFIINFDRKRKFLIGASALIGFLFFLLFFRGSASPTYGEAMSSASGKAVLVAAEMNRVPPHRLLVQS